MEDGNVDRRLMRFNDLGQVGGFIRMMLEILREV
jgi:hypothetical protein